MKTVLLTGFGAYQEEANNPSGAIAVALDGHEEPHFRIHGLVLPVSSRDVAAMLEEAVLRLRPDILMITGVTPGRAAVAAERIAINIRDFPIPDVDGLEAIDDPVVPGAPAAYFSTLPIKAILAAWRERGIPSYVSNSAGTYLCNQTFYLACHLAASRSIAAGLVHIPLSSANAAVMLATIPSMAFDQLRDAVLAAVSVSASHEGPDLKLGAGATC